MDTDPQTTATPFPYDPTVPVPLPTQFRVRQGAELSRQNQRRRRSIILATIRQLIMEDGVDGVTVRRIAECSGHAVQTVYNLVGPRNTAIIEAITEYSRYVGLSELEHGNPVATADVVEHQLRSIEQSPDFCRKVCLIYFGNSRDIYYSFKDNQTKAVHNFLLRQQRLGILRSEADLREIAAQIMLYASALCIEWADRGFEIAELRHRLYLGYYNLLACSIASPGEPLRFALSKRSSTVLN